MIQSDCADLIVSGLKALQRRWPDVRSHSTEAPVFLFSAGWRSGSTFLQRLLTPACFMWGEPYGRSGLIDNMARQLCAFTDVWPQAQAIFSGEDSHERIGRFIANLYPSPRHVLDAHLRFFETLLIEPARRAGAERWGLKEVRLQLAHALYLKWLYPRAKFLFLYRNPYDTCRSYVARRNAGWQWWYRVPDQPLTVRLFGRRWRECARSFLDGWKQVDGLLVRYEALAAGDFAPIEEYLGMELCRTAAALNPSDGGPAPVSELTEGDFRELQAEVEPLASRLGYRQLSQIAPMCSSYGDCAAAA